MSTTPHTSLDPPETNSIERSDRTAWGLNVTSHDPPVLFRHSGWTRRRTLVYCALQHAPLRPRALNRFALCGSDPWVYRNPDNPDDLVIQANYCHSRWCQPCAQARASLVARNLARQLGEDPHRFLTLTLRHSDQPLKAQLDRLYDCFRRLRQRPFWKTAVRGGAAILEVKHAHHGPRWHPHLHIILDGTYLAQQAIKAAWHAITGDSFIVDIRLIRTPADAARYVTKYLTKPIASTVINKPHALLELVRALQGRRLMATFGSWRGFRLSQRSTSIDWQPIAPLDELVMRAERGVFAAYATVRRLGQLGIDTAALTGRALLPDQDTS